MYKTVDTTVVSQNAYGTWVTAFSFYKSNGAESAPILLIIVKWGVCHRDEEGQRILIKKKMCNNTTTKIFYHCWRHCGIYSKVQKVMGSPINEISWPQTWIHLGIFSARQEGWKKMNFPSQCKWVTCLVTLITALLICMPNGQLSPTSGLKEHCKLPIN